MKLMQNSVCPSTRATYAGALRHYDGWCARWRLDASPLLITPTRAINWLTEVGGERQLMHKSLLVFRSALSTAWAVAGGQGDNPVQDPSVARLLLGYSKARFTADRNIREKRKETIALTAELLAEIAPMAPGSTAGTPHEIMLWAAACFLTFGLNRCGEVFRCTRNGRPPLDVSAVEFFDSAHASIPRPLCSGSWRNSPLPDLYSVDLGQTKADGEARNENQRIAAKVAVHAVWRWAHIRRDLGGGAAGPLFAVPGEFPLTRKSLFAAIASWHAATSGGAPPKVTGKAFRRGGNQSLVASGASIPEMQSAGRWRGAGMPTVYSSADANASRALLVSRGLGDLFVAAAGRQL
jgi:hypothetical protein